MTPEIKKALDLALEALKKSDGFLYNWHENASDDEADAYATARQLNDQAITAIKQARSAPAQEPVAWLIPGSITTDFELAKANGDKAVALGKISTQQWNPEDHYKDGWRDALESVKRATPPAQPAPVQAIGPLEGLVGYTPPAQPAPVQEPDLAKAYREELDKLSQRNYELRMENTKLKAAPPAQPAPVQEPYGYVSTHTSGLMHFNKTFQGVYTDTATEIVAVYTTPPAQPAPVQEPDLAKAYREELDKLSQRNYELRMENTKLKAAPPAQPAPVQEPYGYVSTHTSGLMHFNKTFQGVYTDTATEIVAVYTTPPAQPAPVQEPDHSDELTIAYMSGVARGKELAAPVKRPQNCGTGYCSCIECVMEPAPVQEPVAWGCNRYIEDDKGFQIGTDEPELAWGKYAPDDNGWWPLYTSPPAQRTWVGLTDEERTEIRRQHYARTLPLMDAVEAKLKELNA